MKNIEKNILNGTVLLLVCLAVSCKKKEKEKEFDREAMLRTIGTAIVLPSYTDLKDNTERLYTAADNFATTPNNTNLTALQNTWKESSTAWKKSETYTFAYAGDNMLSEQLDAWPTNTAVIETEISGTNALTESYIATTGTTRKGFPAIEYLIFSTSGDADILTKFTTDPNYTRRRDYLRALAAAIKTKTKACFNSWDPTGGNYLNTFITNSSNDAGSSVSSLLNAMVQNLEVVKNEKMGIPLGKKNSGTLHPELVEAKLSALSISHINNNLATLESLFLGSANGVDGMGFDDYLTFVKAEYEGQPLVEVIKNQFTTCYATMNALTPPLETSITTENAKAEAAYLELKKLVVLMKLDMSSQLGILITFSDNDGD